MPVKEPPPPPVAKRDEVPRADRRQLASLPSNNNTTTTTGDNIKSLLILVDDILSCTNTAGEFWLLAQAYSSNHQLAEAIATLKQLPVPLTDDRDHRQLLLDDGRLDKLVKAMVEVGRCVVEFKEMLQSSYISSEEEDVPAMSAAITHIPAAVYWIVRGLVAVADQVTQHTTTMGPLESTHPATNQLLEHKLNNICEELRKQLPSCYQHIDERKEAEEFKRLVRLFESLHIDNMRTLKALIRAKDDLELPLVDGSTKGKVGLDVLRRKHVMLLVSDLNISPDLVSILEQIYAQAKSGDDRRKFEMVWVPVADLSIQQPAAVGMQFESLKSRMPWYSVHHPSSAITKPATKFIREKWLFSRNRSATILVVLDPHGKVVSPNALHMMWTWGVLAFPFTSLREASLWAEETWRLELIVDGIDPTILDWTKDGNKYVFLYGGGDVDWVRKFVLTARAVARASAIPLEMAYVGKSNDREVVKRVIATIKAEKLTTNFWEDDTMVWFFWERVESMLVSKIQAGKSDDDYNNDPIIRGLQRILSFDKEGGGWAFMSKGSTVIAMGRGNTIVQALNEHGQWKNQVTVKDFGKCFYEHHKKVEDGVTNYNRSCRLEVPVTAGRVPENIKCPDCHQFMDKYATFLCTHPTK